MVEADDADDADDGTIAERFPFRGEVACVDLEGDLRFLLAVALVILSDKGVCDKLS